SWLPAACKRRIQKRWLLERPGSCSSICTSSSAFQSLTQVVVGLGKMRINFGQHRAVGMAKQFRDGEVIVAGYQLARGNSVRPRIGEMLDPGVLLQAAEAAIDGVGGPGPASGIQEYLAIVPAFHAALEDVSGALVEPDNPPAFLALGLLRRE